MVNQFAQISPGKFKELLSHISLFALVWGFLGMMLGLINAFDAGNVY